MMGGTRPGSGMKPKLIRAHGREQTYRQWAAELGVTEMAIRRRIADGMSADAAMVAGRVGDLDKPEAWPGARDLPWDEDDRTWLLVEARGAMTLREIGEVMGLSRERVNQLEFAALRKLAKRLGGDVAGTIELLDSMRGERTYPESYAWDE